MLRSYILLGLVATAFAAEACRAQPGYRRADIDRTGRLHVTTSSGREIVVPKDSDQVAFDQIAVSADHRAVGWLALHPDCCTSYPVPLALVVLRDGKRRTFTGDGLPVWRWAFSPDGRRVAFRSAPVHGDAGVRFELREIQTGRLVSSFEPGPGSARVAPAWARALAPR